MIQNPALPIRPGRASLVGVLSVAIVVAVAVLAGDLAGWATATPRPAAFAACRTAAESAPKLYTAAPAMCIDTGRPYSAILHTSAGDITVSFLVGTAPVTVNNFIVLAVNGYFNGTAITKVTDWYVQGGDPTGTGTGGPGYSLPAESGDNNWVPGSIGMTRDASGINGGQFFITKSPFPGGAPNVAYNHFATITVGFDLLTNMSTSDRLLSVEVHKG